MTRVLELIGAGAYALASPAGLVGITLAALAAWHMGAF